MGGVRAKGRPHGYRALTSSLPELGIRTGSLAPTPGTDLWASVSSSVWWARCGVRMWCGKFACLDLCCLSPTPRTGRAWLYSRCPVNVEGPSGAAVALPCLQRPAGRHM